MNYLNELKKKFLRLIELEPRRNGFKRRDTVFYRNTSVGKCEFALSLAGGYNPKSEYKFWISYGIRIDKLEHLIFGVDPKTDERLNQIVSFGMELRDKQDQVIYFRLSQETEISDLVNEVNQAFAVALVYFEEFSQIDKLFMVFESNQEHTIGFRKGYYRTAQIGIALAYLMKRRDAFDMFVQRYLAEWQPIQENTDLTYAPQLRKELQELKGLIYKLKTAF